MGFQQNINNVLGIAAAVSAAKGMQKGVEENTNKLNTLNSQVSELNKPDYGKAMTNAMAEEKSLQALYDAQYGGRKRKWRNDTVKVEEERVTREALATAHERAINAMAEYNRPAGKQFTRSSGKEDE